MSDVFGAVWRHKKGAVLLFIVVMVGVTAVTIYLPKVYQSQGELLVRLGRENAALDPTVALGSQTMDSIPYSRENELNSLVEILGSRVLLEQVVDNVGAARILGKDPSDPHSGESGLGKAKQALKDALGSIGLYTPHADFDKAVQQLEENLSVTPVKRSNVVCISYKGESPELCKEVVADLMDGYLKKHITLNRPKGAHEFLVRQTEKLRDELTAKEEELRKLKDATGLVSPDEQRTILVSQIGNLEEQLLAVNKRLASTAAHVAAIEEEMAATPKTLVASTTDGFSNEGTDGMREQFYALRLIEEEMEARYQESHPKMREIREKVAQAKKALEKEQPMRTRTEKTPNPVYRQGELALMEMTPELKSLKAEADSLNGQLVALQNELQALNEAETRIVQLQREVVLHDSRYRECVISLGKARIDQALAAAKLSNVEISQPATLERIPISPNVPINLALGFVAAVCSGLGLALLLEYRSGFPKTAEVAQEQLERGRVALSGKVTEGSNSNGKPAVEPTLERMKQPELKSEETSR